MLLNDIERAKQHFARLLEEEFARIERMKKDKDFVDYSKLDKIIIGIVGGDGIGPFIAKESEKILSFLLQDEIKAGKVELRNIEGLTIENRAKHNQAIPDDVLEEIKKCDVILKGPTTTPRKGDPWPNIESANVAMRRALDLFANVRPVKVPSENIDWVFFRENTEGAYILGSKGIEVSDELAIDFTATTTEGTERIVRAAFEFARKNNRKRVTAVTKANVIKTTDGKFLRIAQEIAKEYPEIEFDDWYIDIMTAKLIDESRRSSFDVMVLPNLYGDILTDEAAQFQGGVGTAGSANIGKKYAMFEAIHGSAPRMVEEGRAQYADPSSMMRAVVMLLQHINFGEKAKALEMALDICGQYEKKIVVTGRSNGATNSEFSAYLMETLSDSSLNQKWQNYSQAQN
ncbi:MAG: isocitrate/isopropylmalate dehydrogenase family protein [Firmicutes bacterium]|nr:isocitrate/isopropylmalate dehydrogenase family protein [Bacillota bacterium]